MADPKYVKRIARLPEVFQLLASYPDGLAIAELADRVGVAAGELREDLLAFYVADVGPDWLMGLSRPEVLEFLGPDGDEVDPNDAEVVRIVDPRPADELGVEYVDAAELALVYTAARMELDKEWNQDLADAIIVLEDTMFGRSSPAEVTQPSWNQTLGTLQQAGRDRRHVRIVYSRAWQHGVSERVIEPYRLVQTRRGWEVDAGPPDQAGHLRTFLLSNVREAELLDERFELPDDLAHLLDQQRATQHARVRMPHGARWAADMYAEHVTVVEEDEGSVTLDLDLLPPLEKRVGLLLLVAGPAADVVEPAELASARADLAAQLLAHHQGSNG